MPIDEPRTTVHPDVDVEIQLQLDEVVRQARNGYGLVGAYVDHPSDQGQLIGELTSEAVSFVRFRGHACCRGGGYGHSPTHEGWRAHVADATRDDVLHRQFHHLEQHVVQLVGRNPKQCAEPGALPRLRLRFGALPPDHGRPVDAEFLSELLLCVADGLATLDKPGTPSHHSPTSSAARTRYRPPFPQLTAINATSMRHSRATPMPPRSVDRALVSNDHVLLSRARYRDGCRALQSGAFPALSVRR